jgi:hypothetical protein
MGKSDRERRFVHPARLSVSHFKRTKKLDLRTSLGRALQGVRKRLHEDVGGEITEGQQILSDRIIEKLLFLNLISAFVFNQDTIINDKGELLPCLGQNYLQYTNSLREDLRQFYSMANIKTRADESYLDIVRKVNDKQA